MISIIVPIYNSERFLQHCIESILVQTYDDFELILVNDGSTDNSLAICKKFDDKRIIIIDKSNGGVSSARNSGLSMARGEYITFVDSDDFLPQDAMSILMNSLIKNNTDMAVGSFMYHYGASFLRHSARLAPGKYFFDSLMCDFIDDGTLSGFLLGSVWGAIYKTSIIKNNGLSFINGLHSNEDGLFNFEYAIRAESLSVSSECVYYYRQYGTSSTSRRQLEYDYNILIKKHLDKINVDLSKYALDIQFLRRYVSLALWDILHYPRTMHIIEGIKYIRERLSRPEVQNGMLVINKDKLSLYKKIFFILMEKQCSCILYVFVRCFIPILSSKLPR